MELILDFETEQEEGWQSQKRRISVLLSTVVEMQLVSPHRPTALAALYFIEQVTRDALTLSD